MSHSSPADPSASPPTNPPPDDRSEKTDLVSDSSASVRSLDARSLAGAALLVMVFFVLSRVTGLVRDMVIAAEFDLGAALDAYQAAFRIPDLLFELVAGGALGSAFIPTFAGYLAREDERGAWLLFSRVLNWITLILVVLAALAALFAPQIVATIIGPEFPPDQQILTAQLMRWLLLSTVIFGASGLIMGALNAMQHFLLPAVAPVIRNVAIILAALFLAPRYGVQGLVVGAILGAVGHLLVQIPILPRFGARYTPSLTWRDPGVIEVARLMGPRVLGLFFVHLNFIVNTALASGLAAGSLSALTYAWRLMLLPLGIFAQAIGVAAFPTFAAQVAAGEHGELRRGFGLILRTIFFITLPAAAGLIVLGSPLVQILYERGQFTAQSTQAVVYALQFYALGLVFHAGVEIIVRAYYALHDTMTPVIVGVGAMLLNIVLSLWWVRLLSYGGLALANSVATAIEMLVLIWLLRPRLGGLDLGQLLPSVSRSAVATGIMVAAVWGWLQWLEGGGLSAGWLSGGWLAALGGMALAGGVYAGASLLLGSPELAMVRQMVVGRLRTRRTAGNQNGV